MESLQEQLFSESQKNNMIKYWIKILQQNNNSLLKQVYLMLKEDVDLNINYNGHHWVTQIKTYYNAMVLIMFGEGNLILIFHFI